MSKTPVTARVRRLSLPIGLGLVAALAEFGGEPLRQVLRYEREGLINGELWRLISGHLVHLGPGHAAMNVVALGVLAFLFTRLFSSLDWCIAGLVSATAIDAGLFWLSPEVEWYVGLSGVLHGFWAAACVLAFRDSPREATAMTALIGIKLAYEAFSGPVPLTGQIAAGTVIAVAHIFGAAGGALSGFLTLAIRTRTRSL